MNEEAAQVIRFILSHYIDGQPVRRNTVARLLRESGIVVSKNVMRTVCAIYQTCRQQPGQTVPRFVERLTETTDIMETQGQTGTLQHVVLREMLAHFRDAVNALKAEMNEPEKLDHKKWGY